MKIIITTTILSPRPFIHLFFFCFCSHFLDVFVLVDTVGVLVFSLSSTEGDQDEKEKEKEQTVDGDTHSNETCLVCREFVVVRRGAFNTDLDAVGVGIDGVFSVGRFDDDVIVNLADELEWGRFPFEDLKAVGTGDDVGVDRREIEDVRFSEVSGFGAAATRVRCVPSGLQDGREGFLLGDDRDFIADAVERGRICGSLGRFNSSKGFVCQRMVLGRAGGSLFMLFQRGEEPIETGPVRTDVADTVLMIDIDERLRAIEHEAASWEVFGVWFDLFFWF